MTGNCASCHNGSSATGKNSTHIQTTSACEDCHSTTTFAPALRVDHADVLGTCFSCHNGTTAIGKFDAHCQQHLRRPPQHHVLTWWCSTTVA
ncbi:MAG: hypothetical protein R3F42_04920 [Pseudomonadota bacterium]